MESVHIYVTRLYGKSYIPLFKKFAEHGFLAIPVLNTFLCRANENK